VIYDYFSSHSGRAFCRGKPEFAIFVTDVWIEPIGKLIL